MKCYVLMVIEECVIGPACLSAGSFVSKAALGGAEQINPKREEAKKRASEQEQTSCPPNDESPTCSIWTYPELSNTRIQHAHHVIAK